MLMRRWCNGSEVTGDLMRGTSTEMCSVQASFCLLAEDCEMDEREGGAETGIHRGD